jgi:hypothetical protein
MNCITCGTIATKLKASKASMQSKMLLDPNENGHSNVWHAATVYAAPNA